MDGDVQFVFVPADRRTDEKEDSLAWLNVEVWRGSRAGLVLVLEVFQASCVPLFPVLMLS